MVDLVSKDLKIIFLGATKYSKILLNDCLIKNGFVPKTIFSIPKYFNISYSEDKVKNYNYANLEKIAIKHNIDYYEVDSIKGKRLQDYSDVIKSIQPDIILVLGWYYMIPKHIRELAKYGAWGIHSSLLPKYAGGAPLNWAIINGERETGVTLFRMEDGVDDGDIIMQKSFNIDFEDTIKEVYKKATYASKEILLNALSNINNITFTSQDKCQIEVYPQRKPEDGEINLNQSAIEIYNFIRALSKPYPGAFIKTIDGGKLVIEKVRIENI